MEMSVEKTKVMVISVQPSPVQSMVDKKKNRTLWNVSPT